ncbi:hypothetical protein [Mycobacteroides abscessus]|uniref:hypothetical protein n=2 Tax=Mycobacteroides abscessus TaxID=36809 RepID=UPI000B30D2AF|nr:hypothetical protein [Mycobacteroides abscessus]
MAMGDRWRMPSGLRRASAVVAVVALAVGGAKVASDRTLPGSGFSTVATVAADPSGPTGGPGGGPGGMNGSQFQPPGLPPQMPDYQGGINQPPLDQNSGISIYNSGNPQAAQQVPGQEAGQQPQQSWDQPAHGTQMPDYQTNPGYTQGPGKPNPDYQAPQQQSPQQGQQGQQPQQQPSQVPTQTQQPQNQQDDTTRQLDQKRQQCQAGSAQLGSVSAFAGGGGRSPFWFVQPHREPTQDPVYPTNIGTVDGPIWIYPTPYTRPPIFLTPSPAAPTGPNYRPPTAPVGSPPTELAGPEAFDPIAVYCTDNCPETIQKDGTKMSMEAATWYHEWSEMVSEMNALKAAKPSPTDYAGVVRYNLKLDQLLLTQQDLITQAAELGLPKPEVN